MLLDQIFRGASLSGGKLIAQFCQREGVTEEAFRFGLIGLYGRNREAPCWDGAVETIDGALGRLELPELVVVLVGPETDCRRRRSGPRPGWGSGGLPFRRPTSPVGG